MDIPYRPIGIIHSSFTDPRDMPIQPTGASSAPGRAEVFPEFEEGLADLDGFSHIILIYHFHRVRRVDLTVTPFLDAQPHGVFATRAPTRPNPIGLSIVELRRVEGCVLHLDNVDVLNGTPLLDIKPYVPDFDRPRGAKAGWLEKAKTKAQKVRSDDRFC